MDQEQMYSWSEHLERRKYIGKQERYETFVCPKISSQKQQKKHNFMNKASMNWPLLIYSIHMKQFNYIWVPLGSDWKGKICQWLTDVKQ